MGNARALDDSWPNFVCRVQTEEWAKARYRCVTGTALAALMQRHEYQTKASLAGTWHLREHLQRAESRPMWWGRMSEEANIKVLQRIMVPSCNVHSSDGFFRRGPIGASLDAFGVRISNDPSWGEDNAHLVTSAPKRMLKELAHLESAVMPGDIFIIEMKQSDLPRKKWGPTCPDHYWCQMQAQMYVTGLDVSLLAARVGANEMRLYTVEADEEFMAEAVFAAGEFLDEMGIDWRESDGA